MLKLSRTQIQNFEDARRRESTRSIADKMSQTHPERADTRQAEQIAEFCAQHEVLRAENMHEIARVHLALGISTPDAHMTVPLRRRGFSEGERVRAYLYGLEAKKQRLVLRAPE